MSDLKNNKPIFDHKNASLEEWLRTIYDHEDDRKEMVIDYSFPTDKHATEYLETVHTRPDEEVKNVLRQFLIPTGSLGCDQLRVQFWLQKPEVLKRVIKLEFGKRSLTERPTWEGITWVLDLLPDYPKDALNAIHAYFMAHMQFLPDGRIQGLVDAEAIIRARYLNQTNPRAVLNGLGDRDFEYLVASIYKQMGYKVKVTQATRDGGFDILAQRREAGQQEDVFVECKLHKRKLGVREVRALNGVIDAERVHRGVLVCPGGFSLDAQRLAKKCKRIELIDFDQLNIMLNREHGANWPRQIGLIITYRSSALAE